MTNPVDDAFDDFMDSLLFNEQLAPESQPFFQVAAGHLNQLGNEISGLDDTQLAIVYAASRLMLLDSYGGDKYHRSRLAEIQSEAMRRRIDDRRFGQLVRAALEFFRAGTSPDPEDVAMALAAFRNIPDPKGILAWIPGFKKAIESQLDEEQTRKDIALKKKQRHAMQ